MAFFIFGALVGFVVGVMAARNLNMQDRMYWREEGRKLALGQSEAAAK